MPTYSYVALRNNKDEVKGKIDAPDPRSAREAIKSMGLLPTRIIDEALAHSARSTNATAPGAQLKSKPLSLSLKDKIDFTHTLQILIATGIPITESLKFLEGNADSQNVRAIALELRTAVIVQGLTFAEALEKNRTVFGRVYVGLAKAGEDSGELDKTLSRLLELLKKQDAIKGKVIGALIYPVFVVILSILVVIVMLAFVFPAFEGMFKTMGKELPITTRMCIDLGIFLKEFWYVPMILAVVVVVGIIYLFKNESTKRVIDGIVLKVPLLNSMFKFANFSNFIASLQVAYEAGVPIVDCLYVANMTLDNLVLKDHIYDATTKVQQGTHLSVALRSSNEIPNMITFMIATGEQSGRLGEMLNHCTMFIDQKLDAIIDSFTKLVEPIMLIFIGGIVLFLALSLYMPLFQSYT